MCVDVERTHDLCTLCQPGLRSCVFRQSITVCVSAVWRLCKKVTLQPQMPFPLLNNFLTAVPKLACSNVGDERKEHKWRGMIALQRQKEKMTEKKRLPQNDNRAFLPACQNFPFKFGAFSHRLTTALSDKEANKKHLQGLIFTVQCITSS